jgi:hypothetical protein
VKKIHIERCAVREDTTGYDGECIEAETGQETRPKPGQRICSFGSIVNSVLNWHRRTNNPGRGHRHMHVFLADFVQIVPAIPMRRGNYIAHTQL